MNEIRQKYAETPKQRHQAKNTRFYEKEMCLGVASTARSYKKIGGQRGTEMCSEYLFTYQYKVDRILVVCQP